MALRVFYHPLSQPCRAVHLFALVSKIPHEIVPVDLTKKASRTPEYMQKFPLGTAPGLEDVENKVFLNDSAAIMTYMHGLKDAADHWYPKSLAQRAKVDEYLHWHHFGLRYHMVNFFRSRVMMPVVTSTPCNLEKAEAKIPPLVEAVKAFETFLKDRRFLAGDQISIADVQAVMEFSELVEAEAFPFGDDTSRWMQWYYTVRKETLPHFDDVHQEVRKMGQQLRVLENRS